MNDTAQAPAKAYEAVANLVGPDYFVKNPPPREGTRMICRGTDGISTQWDLTNAMAATLIPQLKQRRDVQVSSRPFSPSV